MGAPEFKEFNYRYGQFNRIEINDLTVNIFPLGYVRFSEDDKILSIKYYCVKKEEPDGQRIKFYFACEEENNLEKWLKDERVREMGFGDNPVICLEYEDEVRKTENFSWFLRRGCRFAGFGLDTRVFVLGRKLEE